MFLSASNDPHRSGVHPRLWLLYRLETHQSNQVTWKNLAEESSQNKAPATYWADRRALRADKKPHVVLLAASCRKLAVRGHVIRSAVR
jgi:hypothetical protein